MGWIIALGVAGLLFLFKKSPPGSSSEGGIFSFLTSGGSKQGLSVIAPDAAVYGFDSAYNVQKYLQEKGSILANLRFFPNGDATTDRRGDIPLAAQIIVDTARKHNVKPQFLLVTLDREQGLVSGLASKWPMNSKLQHVLDWATGAGVPDFGPRMNKRQGFQNQLAWAASAANLAKTGAPGSSYAHASSSLGKSMKLLDGTATPTNVATAYFYIYTPHVGAGDLTRKLYQRHAPALLA